MSGKKEILDVAICQRTRYMIIALTSLAIAVSLTMRSILSIAIVAMTDKSTNTHFETFDWSLSIKANVFSAFYWGYVPSNIPTSLIVQRYGARWILMFAILISSLITFMMPLASSAGGWGALCALRVAQGVFQAALLPSINSVLAKWSPPAERGRLSSFCHSGAQLGNIIVFPVSGILASSSGGWPSIFYTFASLGVVWCIFWYFYGYDSPALHPYISEQEKNYIESFYCNTTAPSFRIPWKDMILSGPMWAIVIAQCVHSWGYHMVLTEMPSYMSNILKFDIKSNGGLSALPYAVLIILLLVYSYIADFFIGRGLISLGTSRKVFNSLGFIGPSVAMIGLTCVSEEQRDLAVMLFVLSVALNAGVFIGFLINVVDISPNFACTLTGISNAFSNIVSMIVPIAFSDMVTNEKDASQWATVFWTTAGIYLFGSIMYLLLSSTDVQTWNEPKKDEMKKEAC